ncbi:DNA gyrase inhibitor YacG [uncultured Litoreibacter sp.]|uniref:DNA gyrase inhibitor YacG n=1 Tax=uncultured Litoreibacter sp. TaxID=1392394 RepID=UPI002621E5A0|nr:DNA gyrase inhibitor YacG [uncultured Litoreibacter sp.]
MACPICSKHAAEKYRPFCSKRCADIDLGKWMTGAYAVPSESEDDADELVQELDKAMRERAEDDASKLH